MFDIFPDSVLTLLSAVVINFWRPYLAVTSYIWIQRRGEFPLKNNQVIFNNINVFDFKLFQEDFSLITFVWI